MNASDYNRRIYCQEAKLNGTYYKLFNGRSKKIIQLLDGFEGRLLDVGCGDATITLQLKQALGCEIEAVELIEENVKRAAEKGFSVKKVDLNLEKLPFKSNSFDCVFSGEVLEHVIDSDGLLLDMKRVLKKDGVLILTVPNVANWYNRLIMLFGYLPHYIESGSRKSYGTPFGLINGHVKAFTKRSLAEMIKTNGFKIEFLGGTGYTPATIEKYDKGILKIGAPLFFTAEKILSKKSGFATNLVVKARKL